MSHPVAKLSVAAALLGVGGLCGAALTAGSDPARAPAAAAAQRRAPVEVRTIVQRRTIHVYRKSKRHRAPAAAAATPLAAPPAAPMAAPALVPAVASAPVRTAAPLMTRTSGSGSGREHGEGDDRGEREGDEHGGGDD